METLGVWLRQTREAQGSSLEEVEAETRIRPRFLEALEQGDYGVFPGGTVQIRGFLGFPLTRPWHATTNRYGEGSPARQPAPQRPSRLIPFARPQGQQHPHPAVHRACLSKRRE